MEPAPYKIFLDFYHMGWQRNHTKLCFQTGDGLIAMPKVGLDRRRVDVYTRYGSYKETSLKHMKEILPYRKISFKQMKVS